MLTGKISSLLFSFLWSFTIIFQSIGFYSVSKGQTVWISPVIGVAPGHTAPPITLSCASWSGSVIQVTHANFGTNCGAPSNNRLTILQSLCNGRTSCQYHIGSRGDPAPGCLKDFHYQYRCFRTPAPTKRPTSRPTPIPTPIPTTAEPTPSPYPACMIPLMSDFESWYTGDSLLITPGSSANLWYDQSGLPNNDAIVYGSGMEKYDNPIDTLNELYLNGYPVLVGTTQTIVSFFPAISYQHTVFSVCKYRENGIRRRLIQADAYNGVFGFVSGKSGIAYEGGWITSNSQDVFGSDWVMSSQTRELYRGNKRDLTTGTGPNTLSSQLSINTGWNLAAQQTSDFACAEVILIDREFTLPEIECIEGYLENKYFPDGFTEEPTPQPTLITLAPTLNTPSPTPHPTPSNKTCTSDVRFNIHFIFDESNSIQPTDYDEQILFIQTLVYSDVNPISKVSALAFSTVNDVIWNFFDYQYNSRFPIINALEQEKNTFTVNKPGGTFTYTGLMEAIDMFDQNGTISEPDLDANLMFMITDGAPTQNIPCDEVTGLPTNYGMQIILKLIQKNIRLYILGIGTVWDTYYKRVECLANDNYIYKQPNFTPEEFEKIEKEFRDILCYGQGVISSP